MIRLRVQELTFAYDDSQVVLQGISLEVAPGEMVALLGPNGSGKTTLLKIVLGLLRPHGGQVWLDGQPPDSLSRRRIAQQVAVVPQHFHMPFAFTVQEVVMLGRTPHVTQFMGGESPADRKAVRQALEFTGLTPLASRSFHALSGGERQKVMLALALAQEPRLLLLDEPVAHLDIRHQVETMELVNRLNQEQGLTMIAAMHDLNLAAQYCNRLVMLSHGRIVADGSPSQVLTAENIQGVYGADVCIVPHPTHGTPVILPKFEHKISPQPKPRVRS
ncbi:MAG: heme ABC transporter ATP-binding protein [Chloroflexi bacterium]|nr:heme ABC transporter ATP-binding protein [Chloroflexota bacterium]